MALLEAAPVSRKSFKYGEKTMSFTDDGEGRVGLNYLFSLEHMSKIFYFYLFIHSFIHSLSSSLSLSYFFILLGPLFE